MAWYILAFIMPPIKSITLMSWNIGFVYLLPWTAHPLQLNVELYVKCSGYQTTLSLLYFTFSLWNESVYGNYTWIERWAVMPIQRTDFVIYAFAVYHMQVVKLNLCILCGIWCFILVRAAQGICIVFSFWCTYTPLQIGCAAFLHFKSAPSDWLYY